MRHATLLTRKTRLDPTGMEYNLSKTNYQTQVYNILEQMIVYGKLKPGQRLIESELAASLGVSRSPVREAIIALCQEKLVRNEKGQGWIVSEISLQDIMESYEVRKLIEVHSGRTGCLDCPSEIIGEMKVIMSDLEKPFEMDSYREKNKRFHELIVLSCGNKKLQEVFLWAMKNLRWCGYLAMEVAWRREQTTLEHRRILEGFINKNQDDLGKAISDHISSIQNIISSNWDQHGFSATSDYPFKVKANGTQK
jgi:DNA-binding GntR family transcriptional regulator